MTVHARMVEVVALKDRLFRKFHLEHWNFGFDHAKRRYGCCRYTPKKITLSRYFCSNLDNNMTDIEDTILHEIAHALMWEKYPDLKMGHGIVWKSIARKIGCSAKRTSNKGEMPQGKYQAFCSKCGDLQHFRHRMSKAMRQGRYRCPKCRSRLAWRQKVPIFSV